MPRLDRPALLDPPHASPTVTVTELDFSRLQQCVDAAADGPQEAAAELLDAELARARRLASAEVPADVVTMNSRVVFEDVNTGASRTVTLVYPRDANAAEGRISVLAPVGIALLGLSVGQSIERQLPSGKLVRIRLLAIEYQPELAGHFHL